MCATWSVTLAFHGWSCASTFAIIQGLLQLVTLVPKKSSQPQAELEFQWQPPVSQIHKICPALPSIVLIMTQNLFHHQNGQSLSSKISMGSGRHIRQLIGSFHHHSTSFMSQTPSRNKPAPQSRDRDMKAVAKSDHGSTRDKGKQTQRTATGHEDVWLPTMAVLRSHHSCGSLDLTPMDIYHRVTSIIFSTCWTLGYLLSLATREWVVVLCVSGISHNVHSSMRLRLRLFFSSLTMPVLSPVLP